MLGAFAQNRRTCSALPLAAGTWSPCPYFIRGNGSFSDSVIVLSNRRGIQSLSGASGNWLIAVACAGWSGFAEPFGFAP
jgi:hypothetical protein